MSVAHAKLELRVYHICCRFYPILLVDVCPIAEHKDSIRQALVV